MPDRVMITPKDVISADGKVYNLYYSILDSRTISYTKVRSRGRVSILVDKYIMDAVRAYATVGFAGLSLVAYLRKVFPAPREPSEVAGTMVGKVGEDI